MSDAVPQFWSRRFFETLWRALTAQPLRASVGLYWFVTARRVRGWSVLAVVTSERRDAYSLWIRKGEPCHLLRFQEARPIVGNLPVLCLLTAEKTRSQDELDRTIASIHAAFGGEAKIYGEEPTMAGCKGLPGPTKGSLASIFQHLLATCGPAWVVPLRSGDILSVELGDVLRRSALIGSGAAVAFWDEDRILDRERADPWIKPSWDPDLFAAKKGLTGASAVSLTAAVDASCRSAHLKLDDVDVETLIFELGCDPVHSTPIHIPLVLTHRLGALRPHESVPAISAAPRSWPKVSILIPTRDKVDLLKACLSGFDRLAYEGEIETIVVDNGSVDPAAIEFMELLRATGRARILRDPEPFNFSRLNNFGARCATGEFLCLINNDIEARDGTWLSVMVRHAMRDGIGAVGALLLYSDNRVQHAGVVIGIGGAAGHVQKGVPVTDPRFATWHRLTRQVSAVTAAAMVVRTSTFFQVGGFDEAAFPVAFNDVDFCLRLQRAGFRNLFASEARLNHHESESRGDDRSPENAARFAVELKNLQDRWQTKGFSDPHFSPLFSTMVERCVLTD